jgi:ABC-type multidrug transport system ATPase subunit
MIVNRATAAELTAELLDFMQLADRPKTLIADYSHGMKKKLALAAAVIHAPKILFLDEPFEGVDAIAADTLKAMLQRMIARGATIFLTSHVLNAFAATWPSSTRELGWRRAPSRSVAPESSRAVRANRAAS